MSPLPINDTEAEHLIYDALVQLGWQADAKRLSRRIARLHLGLPREDEFAVVCTWLGRCAVIHKLDQRESPKSTTNTLVKVPDLLAIFIVNGQEVPVLIEVKSKKDDLLSFKADYYTGLKRYASILKLPLLVAWKHHGMWALFDIDHMKLAQTNYNIKFPKALNEGLLGLLAGDFAYSLAEGSGVHLRMRKEQLISESQTDEVTTEQNWQVRFDDIYNTDGLGNKRRNLNNQIQALFQIHALDNSEDHTDTHVILHFTVGEDKNKFAHMSLVDLLNWQTTTGEDINWRTVATRDQAVLGIDDFTNTINDAYREKIVTHIFHIRPQTHPSFVPQEVRE